MNEIAFARAVFLLFFAGLGIGVLLLPGEYVFRGAPSRARWRDLRLWAIALVAIHVLVYYAL